MTVLKASMGAVVIAIGVCTLIVAIDKFKKSLKTFNDAKAKTSTSQKISEDKEGKVSSKKATEDKKSEVSSKENSPKNVKDNITA